LSDNFAGRKVSAQQRGAGSEEKRQPYRELRGAEADPLRKWKEEKSLKKGKKTKVHTREFRVTMGDPKALEKSVKGP